MKKFLLLCVLFVACLAPVAEGDEFSYTLPSDTTVAGGIKKFAEILTESDTDVTLTLNLSGNAKMGEEFEEFYPDDNKLLQLFCQLTTWSNLYALSYLKLTKILSKRYHYLHLSKEEIEEIEGGEIICPKYKSIQNQDLI